MATATASPARTSTPLGALGVAAYGSSSPAGNPSSPAPSANDLEVAGLVRVLFQRAREAKRPLVTQWRQNYRALNGRDPVPLIDPSTPGPNIREMWPIVCSVNAWLTDQRPVFEIIPSAVPFSDYSGFYAQLAADMTATLAVNFHEHLLDAELYKGLWDVATYGICWFKTEWKPWLADGLGDVVFERCDPFTVFPDPYANDTKQMNFIIEAKVMTVADVERSFPGYGKKAEAGWLEHVETAPHKLDATVNSNGPRVNLSPLSGSTHSVFRPSQRGQGSVTDAPVVTVLYCWLRTTVIKGSKVHDSWRCLVVCGNVVLLDKPSEEVNAFSSHPYTRLVAQDTGEMYGPCLVEMLTSPQQAINRTLSNIEYNLALMANPMMVEDPRSGSRNKRITNRPGQRVEANPAAIAWLNPPQMQPQIAVEMMSFYLSRMEAISGLSAIVRGFSPTGRNAQGVIDSVQDAAFVRVRASLREVERAMKEIGKRMVATVAEFYTEPRLLSILGPDGQRTSMALKARHFYVQDEREREQGRIPMRFNLIADAGSQLATSREARGAEAERLFALGVIDDLEVLKAKQWPNWAVVARRVQEMKAAAAASGQPAAPGARQRTRA